MNDRLKETKQKFRKPWKYCRFDENMNNEAMFLQENE